MAASEHRGSGIGPSTYSSPPKCGTWAMQYVVALRLVFARATDAYLVIIVNFSISTTL